MTTRVDTYTTAASGAQDGSYVSGGWEEAIDGIAVAAGLFPSAIGLAFDWGLTLDAANRPIDPPVVVSLSLSLTTHRSVVADPGAELLELWVVPEAHPDLYTVSSFPFGRDEILIAGVATTWTGAPTTITFTLGSYPSSAANDAICEANWDTLRMTLMGSSRWRGRLVFAVQATLGGSTWTFASEESTGETPPTLSSTQESYHTGVDGWPTDKGRCRRCPVTGKPLLADDAVRDEYREGLWVSAEAADPEDRSGRDFYPPPGEGVADDELT